MHKRRHTVKLDGRRVAIDGKEIDLTDLRPIDLMLAALAYGIGIRYIDKTREPYEMECEVDGYNVTCRAKCTGEEKCLIYQTLTKGLLKLLCTKE